MYRICPLKYSHFNISDQGAEKLVYSLALNTTLNRLDLTDNYISDQGAEKFELILGCNTNLRKLDLAYNIITDKGVKALMKGVAINDTLTSLRLTGNKIGDKGAEAIAKELIVHKTVNLKVTNDITVNKKINQALLVQYKILKEAGGIEKEGAFIPFRELIIEELLIGNGIEIPEYEDPSIEVAGEIVEDIL